MINKHCLAAVAVGVLIFVMAACASSFEDPHLPSPTVSKISPSPKKTARGSSATFKHFKVTASKITQKGSRVRLFAKVCVRSLPPNPQGNRTPISWDPWSVRAGGETIKPNTGTFPARATYKVRQCASGWIGFKTSDTVTKIKYQTSSATKLSVMPGICPISPRRRPLPHQD
jgi:hypothetical protein